ncbi:MAG TPA: hypothetical protein VLU43_17625 [Anaeromyxobacteraceae bacterium]|nr:hypothetical protein [Anaeromyxobacteraceae bacterium]
MFRPEPSIAFVPASRESVVAVVESINQPQVQIPGKPAQATFGHLVGIRNGNQTFSIYVGLHLPKTGENVVYVHDKRQLTAEEYREVEVEGLHFLESMGFMLDNLNFRSLQPQAQDEMLKRISLFAPPRAHTPVPGAGGPAAPASEATRIARLLASF